MAAPGAAEQILAVVHARPTSRDGSIVGAVVEAAAPDLGLSDAQGAHLGQAVRAVARAVYARGFDVPDEAALDVTVLRLGHRAVVRIDDLGLPFNAAAEDALDLDVITEALRGGWIDTMAHESRGRQGNRTVLVRHLDPGHDHRDGARPVRDVPTEVADAGESLAHDLEVLSRRAELTDVEGICQLAWRTYGYSYQHDEYYQPERLAAMLRSGQQASFVVVTPDGEIVGHSAVLLDHPDDVIVEGGRAMVDPRFRGHHLMGASHERMVEWMRANDILALEGAAVTAHTRSQSDRPVTSIQLGFLPAIEFRGIEGSEVPHREAVAGGIVPVVPIPDQAVVLPARDAAMIQEIYAQNDLPRTAAAGRPPVGGSRTELALEAHADLGHAVITCTRIGVDLPAEVRARVAAVTRGGLAVVYADVPLDQPEASWAADVLHAEGFVFAGVLPLALAGTDAVRYQWLGPTVVDRADIHLKHPFARTLLDYVLDQHAAVTGEPIESGT